MIPPTVAEGRCGIHERPAEKREPGTAGQGPGDVGPGADPTVDHHGRPSPHRLDDRPQRPDRRQSGVELPAAMIGDDDPVEPACHRDLGILHRRHSLEHHLPLPAVAEPGEVVAGEPAGECPIHEVGKLAQIHVRRHVGGEGRERRLATPQHRHSPHRAEDHLEDRPRRQPRRHGELVANVVGAIAEGGNIGEDDEDLAPRPLRAGEEILPDGWIDRIVELKPKRPRRDLADRLQARRRAGAEDEGDPPGRGCPGEGLAGPGPDQPLEPHRTDAQRRSPCFPKQLGLERHRSMIGEIKRLELDVAEIGGVARQVDVVVAAAVEEVEHESGDPSPGGLPQIVDGGITVIEREGHAFGESRRGRIRAG